MNPTNDPNRIRELVQLPKRLGELAASIAPKHFRSAQPKSPISAVLEHVNTPRTAAEKARDTLKSHEFIMGD